MLLNFLSTTLLISYFQNAVCDVYQGTVYMTGDGVAKYVAGHIDKTSSNVAAYGTYDVRLMSTGWNVLDIHAGYGTATSNEELMYAAGYVEGVLTASEIHDHYVNMRPVFLGGKSQSVIKKVETFLVDQLVWSREMANKYRSTDAFWRHVGYVIAQLDGLHDGYKFAAKPDWDTDYFVVLMLNGVGDLIDLMHALDPANRPQYDKMHPHELLQYVSLQGHCSALVKTMGAYEDLFLGHSSWFVYSATLRIYKHYDFNLDDLATAAKRTSFSSYPGFLESLDDFYLMDSQVALLQTTNNVFNMTLYELIKPQSLPAWTRVRVANHLAHGGQEWYEAFKRENSGTYNNQYMVIDLKKIQLGESIDDDALWVVEQIPGLVAGSDQSTVLRAGYWPSYNVPFYEEVYNRSGYPDFVKKHGLDFSYQLAPRAKIFRRDQATVKDIKSFQHILRYNDYEHDTYSEDNPCNTICCRGDLDAISPKTSGCYDTKVADYKMARSLQSLAINGPTLGDNLKPFAWTGSFANASHIGLPEKYDFAWQPMQPQNHN